MTVEPMLKPPRWFCTAAFAVARPGGRGLEAGPKGTVHAKTYGCLTTACGLFANSWPKFFEMPFAEAGPIACPDCRRALQADLPVVVC